MSFKPSRSLIFLGWILILVCFYLLFRGLLSHQENPNHTPVSTSANGIHTVILQSNRDHMYQTVGKINGHPVTLLLDTGATNVSLSARLADKLGLKRGPQGIADTANGIITTYFTHIDSLEIGNITLKQIPATITSGMNHQDSVLLGMSALRQLHVTFDNGQLILRQKLG